MRESNTMVMQPADERAEEILPVVLQWVEQDLNYVLLLAQNFTSFLCIISNSSYVLFASWFLAEVTW